MLTQHTMETLRHTVLARLAVDQLAQFFAMASVAS